MFYLVKNNTEIVTCATEAHFLDVPKAALEGVEVIDAAEYARRTAVPKGVDTVATGDVVTL